MIRQIALVLALSSAPALASDEVPAAATLSQQQGTVLVNQGEVFATAADQQALQAGDRVMVMEGGSAVLVFADGCELPLAAGTLLEVPAVSTCASGDVAQVQRIGPHYAQAVGDDAGSDGRRGGAIWLAAGTLVVFYALTDNDPQELPPPSPISP